MQKRRSEIIDKYQKEIIKMTLERLQEILIEEEETLSEIRHKFYIYKQYNIQFFENLDEKYEKELESTFKTTISPTNHDSIKTMLEINELNMNNNIYKTMTNGKYNNKNQEFEFNKSYWNTIKNNIHHLTMLIIPNTTKTELKNLKYIKSNMNLIIKPIDKGLDTAIFNKKENITFATTQHLNGHSTFTHLSKNPLMQTVNTIKAIIKIEKTSKNQPKSTANQLMPKSPYQLGKFYILHKLHKYKLQTRPIISNINHPTSNISEFLHKQMLKTTTTTQTYKKNSFELKEQLKNIKIDKN
jgi:hypothetical protein